MISRKLVFLYIAIFSLTLFNTCDKNPTESDEPAEPKVSDLVIVIPPEIIPFIEEVSANSIRFENIPDIPFITAFFDSIKTDIVLVCEPCENAPYGFLRKITGPSTDRDGDPEFPTSEGRLVDIYDEADIDTTQQMFTSDIERST